jgi:hypothetical protein
MDLGVGDPGVVVDDGVHERVAPLGVVMLLPVGGGAPLSATLDVGPRNLASERTATDNAVRRHARAVRSGCRPLWREPPEMTPSRHGK